MNRRSILLWGGISSPVIYTTNKNKQTHQNQLYVPLSQRGKKRKMYTTRSTYRGQIQGWEKFEHCSKE